MKYFIFRFYQGIHFSEHYKPIMDTVVALLVKSNNDLLQIIDEQMCNRSVFEKERSLLVNRFLPSANKIASQRKKEFLNNA